MAEEFPFDVFAVVAAGVSRRATPCIINIPISTDTTNHILLGTKLVVVKDKVSSRLVNMQISTAFMDLLWQCTSGVA